MLPALLLALAVTAPAAAGERCSPPAVKNLESPASYATAVVGALGRAYDGTTRIDTTQPQGAPDLLKLVRVMQGDFACAARYVAPFEKSRSEGIRAIATRLAKALGALRNSLDGQAAWLRYVQGEAEAGREPDAEKSEALLAKAVERRDAAAREAALAAIDSLSAIVEMKDGEPTGRMRLTRAEREKLAAALLAKFGEAVRTGPSTDKDFATNAASGWYQVVTNPEYGSME